MKRKFLVILLMICTGIFPLLAGLQTVSAANETASPEEPLLTFPVLSNTLIQSNVPETSEKLVHALEDLHQIDPASAALILDGDIVGGASTDEYDVLQEALQQTEHPPTYYTIGNHEFYHAWYNADGNWSPGTFPNGESDQDSINRYLDGTGVDGLYYDRWIGDYHFIFLGSELYRQTDPTVADNAYLSDTQLTWLTTKLAENASVDKPIFLFLHQSMATTVQQQQLKDILYKYPQVVWFHGDSQSGFDYSTTMTKNGYTVFNTSSVLSPLNSSGQPISPEASEGLFVQVYPDRVVVKARDFAGKAWKSGQEYTVQYPVASVEDNEAPTWPANSSISLFNLRSTSVHLSWTPATDNVGVSQYKVLKDGAELAVISANEPSYVAGNLEPEKTYTFKVEARDQWGNWTQNGPSVAVTTGKEDVPDGPALLSFPVLSDIHVNEWNSVPQNKFRNALEDLNNINPNSDTLIINGDLTTDGTEENYDEVNQILNEVNHPQVKFTIGNHEFYKAWHNAQGDWDMDNFPNGETEEMSINRFLQKTGTESLYRDEWIKDFHFIFLGSEQYRQSNPTNGEDAYLSDDQLNWLEQKVGENASSDKPIFVFLHQPLPYTVSGSTTYVNNRAVIQHERLTEILSEYPQVVYFSGHTHWSLNMPTTIAKKQFTMFNSSTTWDPLNSNDQSIGPNESEGLYVQVYPNKVVVKGRDFYRKEWISGQEYSIDFAARPDLADYDFAESATLDNSPAHNNGTAVGQPQVQYDETFKKNVLKLDGESYVRIPDNTGLRPKTVTMAASFSLDSLDEVQDVVAKNQTSDYGLEFNPDTKRLEAWIYVVNAGEGHYVVTESPVLQANTKYEAAVTYDGSQAVFYLEGKKVDSEAAAGEIGQAGDPVDLAIGADPEANQEARSFFKGKIGYVKIYSKALSEEQITGVGQTPDAVTPEWPEGSSLTAGEPTTSTVNLTWTPASDNVAVTQYAIYSNGQLYKTVSGSESSTKVTGLTPETSYTFKVEAGDAAGNFTHDGPSITAVTAALPPVVVGQPDLLNYTFAQSAVLDSSPSHNDGEIVGNADIVYDAAFRKNVLKLGGDSSYIKIADNDGLRPQQITLAASFSLDSLEGTQDVVAKNQTSDYGLEFNPATKKLESWTYINGGYVVLESAPLTANQVYHAIVTYDGHENALYMDGVKVDSEWIEGAIAQQGIVDLAIGADPEVNGARSYFSGKIGYVQIYSRGMTEQQVQQLYGQLAPAPNAAPVVSLLEPAEDSHYRSPAAIAFKAAASDSDGTVANVSLYNGDVKLGDGIPAADGSYILNWTVVAAGTYHVRAVATDNEGLSTATPEITVTVEPPAPVSLVLSKTKIWPVNHKLVPIHVTLQYPGDNADIASVTLTSIQSSEPENDSGSPNIQDAAFGTNDMDFQLKAERSPQSNGRVYSIVYTITFVSGDTSTAAATVTVPHDASGK